MSASGPLPSAHAGNEQKWYKVVCQRRFKKAAFSPVM